MIKRLLPAIILVTIFSVNTFAGGFQINEHGAKAMAMGGAFVGLADDPSAAYFNPAGITQLEGTHIMGGATFIMPISTFTSQGWGGNVATDMETKIFYPINFYFTHQLTDDLFVGLSVNNPYGLGTFWAEDWIGRYVAYESEMRTFFINPVVAYKFSDELSIAVGGVFVYGDVTISNKTFLAPGLDATTDLEGDGTSMGFTAGILFKPNDDFQWGFTYKSETNIDFEGTAVTTPAAIPMEIPGMGTVQYTLPTGGIIAKFTTPWMAQFGLAANVTDKFKLTFDAQLTGWSSFDTLAVDFNEYLSNPLNPASGLLKLRDPKKYNNNYIFRLGGEYIASEDLAIRGGILYDFAPSPDKLVEASLPDADDWGFSAGIGYKLTPSLTLDLAYMFLLYPERSIGNSEVETGNPLDPGFFNGKYETTAHLFALDFTYSL
ncbi:OmpP1/FadL family transporter [Bacteroidota bacterium]